MSNSNWSVRREEIRQERERVGHKMAREEEIAASLRESGLRPGNPPGR